MSSSLVELWKAMLEGDASSSALPYCHLQGSLWSALLFRAAIHDEFRDSSDSRYISRRVHEACRMIPESERERLLARREAEAVIRAEVNGERDLVQYVHESPRSAFFTAQVVTREVFADAVGSGRAEPLAARIVEVWDAFVPGDWFYDALKVSDPRPSRSDDLASEVRSLAAALGPAHNGGER